MPFAIGQPHEIDTVERAAGPVAGGWLCAGLEVQGAGKLLFISGQIPQTAGGEVPDDFEAQAALVWRNVLAQLHAAGLGVDALVKVTTVLASREHAEANREARQHALGVHTPALTVIITGIFDERWLLEIEAIAAAP